MGVSYQVIISRWWVFNESGRNALDFCDPHGNSWGQRNFDLRGSGLWLINLG
jgi:hypothetical protein